MGHPTGGWRGDGAMYRLTGKGEVLVERQEGARSAVHRRGRTRARGHGPWRIPLRVRRPGPGLHDGRASRAWASPWSFEWRVSPSAQVRT
jgi:hypothetical protein